MRRVLRIMFNALTVLSLLPCVATAVLWVRSYWVADNVLRQDTQWNGIGVVSNRGGITFWSREIRGLSGGPDRWDWRSGPTHTLLPFGQLRWSLLGFASSGVDGWAESLPYHDEYFRIPHWAFTAVSGALPVAWLGVWNRRRIRIRRLAMRRCPACGYDLRATPDRCPECGASSRADV